MAIKADRLIVMTDISFYCNELVEKGQVLSIKTVGSGISMDQNINVVTASANSSGVNPIGAVLEDVVSLDLSRFPINWHRDQANSGDKVCLLTKGWLVTNKVFGTPVGGNLAVLCSSGTVTGLTRGAPFNEVAQPRVGHFITSLDSAGYAKVYFDI